MKEINSARRAFFLKGGAVVGASVASAGAGAATLLDGSADEMQRLRERLGQLEDREALRGLHEAFTTLLDRGAFEALPSLFSADAEVNLHGEEARGEEQLRRLFTGSYGRQEAAQVCAAHRREGSQEADRIELSEDRRTGRASFHHQVLLSRPLRGASSLAEMARQQGMSEESRWESGRYEVDFARQGGQWLISRLAFRQV